MDDALFKEAQGIVDRVRKSVTSVIEGQSEVIDRVLCCLAAGGHLLLEDYPGTGKTTLAKSIAQSVAGASFQRVQFTPDLLPSDVLGVSILDQKSSEFRFQKGPVFCHVLLADEINRASPRTQSAMLEVMSEGQVTVEGHTYPLDDMFLVIATQNPVEFRGTYPLPEAQMDRFSMQCSLGYLDVEAEMRVLGAQQFSHPLDSLSTEVSLNDIIVLRDAVKTVTMTKEIQRYIVSLVSATRSHKDIQLPASPRASIALMKISQAIALFSGSHFVTPDHVQSVAEDVIAHRLVIDPEARFSGRDARSIVREILSEVEVPV